MPRIDPSQLLRTLSVLLAKDGGIRSAEEVPRIVQLMQKFSKKLVSKCIYIHILRSSELDLLESFLSQKGWDLLNMWFSDAIKNQNYYLCGDLVKLFAVCPMNSARLKENVEINQAPKLIRQLSCDTRIEQTVRNLALQVLQQWMSVIRSPNPQISNSGSTNGTSASNNAEQNSKVATQQESSPSAKVKPRPTVSPKKPSPSKEKKIRSNVIVDTSESEDNVDNDDSKDYNPNDESDIEGVQNDKSSKVFNPIIKTLKRDTSKDDSTDVDDLLGGDTTSEDERPGKISVKEEKKSKKDSETTSEAALRKKKEEREREREREKEKEERRRKERERERRKAQERKDKAKPYSRTELRTGLDSSDKEKIKDIAKKLKEESGASSGLGRIPKLVRPDVEKDEKKKNGSSFGDMLGVMDVKKPKPKAPPIKNKNKDLLESINNPSPLKPKPKHDIKLTDEKLRKEKERRSSFSGKSSESERKSKNDKNETPEKVSESLEKEKPIERPKPKVIIPEKTAEKRSYKESSPKVETKKSPSVIKESNFLGDILGDMMKEPPRKKKRRPSDVKEVKTEKETKEIAEKKNGAEKEKEKSPEEEKMETSENGDELAFSEPTSDLPREVRGILVYVKGSKAKKKIQWKPEGQLVEIEYFEMDETERTNVWKMKTFEEMKKKEAMFEKNTKISGGLDEKEEEQDQAPRVWKLITLHFDSETLEVVEKLWENYGRESGEKSVQEQRELRVLKSIFFSQQIPCDPSEPDPGSCDKTGEDVKEIPPDDLSDNRDDSSYDHGSTDWPVPTLQSQQAPPPINSSSLNALLKDLNPSLLASIPPPHLAHQPPPTLNPADAKLFAAQAAAAEAMSGSPYPLSTPPPGMGGNGPPPPHNGFSGYQPGYQDRGSHRGHNNYDRGFKGGNSNYHHNQNNHYNKNYKGRDGRDNREDHRDNHRDRGFRDRQDYKRPCRFWMERGKCKEEDRCMYPHPSR